MRRRQLLAGGATLLSVPLAGCGHPPNVLDMREATDQRIAEEASRSVPSESDLAGIMADAVANGTTNATGSAPPVEGDKPVQFRGQYYNVSVTELASRQVVRYDIRIDYDPGDVTPADGRIAYEDLPAVDKNALEGLIPPDTNRSDGAGYDVGVVTDYPDDAVDRSVLVPNQQYDLVTYRGETYRVRVERQSVSRADYRINATRIADSTAAFADMIRSRYLFTLSGLSDAEREVVETAIADGYFGEATEAFRSVVARLLAHRALADGGPRDSFGTWLAEYEGTAYITYAEYPPDVTPMP